jgi:hypothetical protein
VSRLVPGLTGSGNGPEGLPGSRAGAEGHFTTAHYNLHHSRAWLRNVDEQGFLNGSGYFTLLTVCPARRALRYSSKEFI